MGKRRREAESDSAMPSTAECSTVFVDTSLDTHLAMLLSDSDTVLDFKRKLTQEHAKCFPNNGEIQIHSLKVKRKGNFYHLPDFMLVCSALHGVKGNWFLSADASGSLECYINQKASECDTRDQCGVLSSYANKILALTTSLPDGVTEENVVSGIGGQKVEKFSDRTAEFRRNDSLENSLGTRSPAKKRRKTKYHEAILHSPTLEDHCTQFLASGEETLQPVLAGCRIDVGEETPKIMLDCMEETAVDAGVRYDPSNKESSAVVEGASVAATVTDAYKQKKINKRRKKPPHGQAIETTLSSSYYCKEEKSLFSNTADSPGSVNLSKPSGIPEDGQCDNNSKASCPSKGTNVKEPDTCHLALKVDDLNQFLGIKVKEKASSSTNDTCKIDGEDKETYHPDIDDEPKVLSQNHDQVLLHSEKLGTLDQHEVHRITMGLVSADDYPGANKEMGCGNRSKKAKKSGGKTCYDADGELSENVMHMAPLTLPNLELNTLKHYETARTDSALPTTDTDLNVGNKKDRDLSAIQQSDLNQCELDVSTKEANSSAILMDVNGSLSIGNNSRKKWSQKAAAAFQDISDVELKTKKSGSTGPITRTSKSRKKDEKRELSINHDLGVMLPSYNNTFASAASVVTSKIGSPSRLLDTNNLEKSEISGNSRKKKVKKFADNYLGKSAMKQGERKAMNQLDLAEEQRKVSLSHDPVPIEFEKLGTSDWHDAVGNIRESAQTNSFSCTEGEMGHGIKKKRKANKSQSKILNETDDEHSDNGVHLTPIAVPNLDLNLLNDPETKITYSILPIAEADLDVGTKQDKNLLGSHEIGMNQPEAGAASIIEPNLPSRLINGSGASDDTHNNNDKRKKKKSKKSAGEIQDTSYRENEPQKAIGDDALHHDLKVMPPPSSKASECVDPELKSNVAGFTTKVLDVNMVEEPKTSRGHRRKQSTKKSASTSMDDLDMEPAYNGTSGSSTVLLCSQTENFPEETDKGENISFPKVKDVQLKMLDDSAADSETKVGDATINEPDSMKLTHTMEDVGICEQRAMKKDQNSAGDCLAVPSVIEKENQMNNLEPNRAQDSTEIVRVKDKKAKRKTKGRRIASDCLENMPIKNQEVGVEEYSTMEKANNLLDFEQDCQHVDSQVSSQKGEEKLGEIHFTAASTDNLVRHAEDKDEGVNFKHYFLPGQKQDKVAYVGKVQEAIKSSEETKTVKKVKKRGLPSVSTSTELHNSAKLSENKDGKDKSRDRCSSGRKDGDFILSSKVSGNGVIDSSPTEMRGITTRKKHSEKNVASPFTNDKNTPLDKSCLEMSGMFSGNGENKRRQPGLDVSDKVVLQSTRKNSLFTKAGSLFQDCSDESSSDENRTANSDASTCSPSDSSSQSGCSAGETDLSQASAKNGFNDAQGRVSREKNNVKFDLSASNEMTLDMILRSSKRFKKAKLIASQNELEQIDSQLEFVPDSEPINE